MLVTFLKSVYDYFEPELATHFISDPLIRIFCNIIAVTASGLYNNIFIIRWFWPWMSNGSINEPFGILALGILLCPTFIVGVVLLVSASLLIRNAKQLKTWMHEVKALLVKEDMRASLRPGSGHQSIGTIQAGRDVRINQEIISHYSQRPDNPKLALITAIIGAIAVILAAIIAHY